MNLGISSVGNNYNAMNCKRNAPSFGMAMLVDKTAEKIIKDQVRTLKPAKAEAFWNKLEELRTSSESNPVNWIIRKCKHRNALAAEVVDSTAETAVKNSVHTQPHFFKNGSLKFAEKAEAEAKSLNELNEKLAALPKAEESHYFPGGVMPE